MIKKLTRHGNSLALVIDKAILELLDVSSETPLEISTDGQVLIISPVRDSQHRKKFARAFKISEPEIWPCIEATCRVRYGTCFSRWCAGLRKLSMSYCGWTACCFLLAGNSPEIILSA